MKPGRKAGAKLIKDRKQCSRGHEYKKHGYKDSSGNKRCRACTKLGALRYAGALRSLNERRAKAKKGAVKKLHGNYAGEKKVRKAAPKKKLTPGLGPVRVQGESVASLTAARAEA